MKPIITASDYELINSVIENIPSHQKTKVVGQLNEELSRAQIVNESSISNEVIRLNSTFKIMDVNSNRLIEFTITLPDLADLSKKKISVLTPLAVALIGFKKGMVIDWVLPGGPKKIKILNVINK
jgi:regulator of nucleoside diphosphate kinase